MKIGCWNVNSVRARLPLLLEWLKKCQPDIVFLQELKCLEEAFPYGNIEDLGYNHAVFGQKTYNGVAILSKYPIEDVQKGIPGIPQAQDARYIEAVVGQIRVASVYVPNGGDVGTDKFQYKLAFLEGLLAHMTTLLQHGEKVVIGGDYNIAPFSEDLHQPDFLSQDRLLCSSEERKAFRRFLNLGFYDALRTLYPVDSCNHEELYTWWDYREGSWGQNKGWRIDHFLLSPQAADHLKEGRVDREFRGKPQPSDHAPFWIEVA